MSDRDRWELRGPVRTLDLHRTWPAPHCGAAASDVDRQGDHTILEFRPDGQMLRHWHRNPDGSQFTATHSFDSSGRLTDAQWESSAGSTRAMYQYDSLGRLTRHLTRDAGGNERICETYSYDANGRQTKTHFVDLPTQRPDTHYSWGIEGSKLFYPGRGAAKVITACDPAGRPLEVLFHNASGDLLSRVDLRYDESGHLIEEIQTSTQPLFPNIEQLPADQRDALLAVLAGPVSRMLHRYDEHGQRIETVGSTFGALAWRRETFTYNEHGDLLAQTLEENDQECALEESGQLIQRPGHQTHSETRFQYEYDSRGNWTSKITAGSSEQRTLHYFETL